MINKLLYFRGEIFWVVLGQVITFIGSIVAIKVLSVIMGTTGYGQLALGLTISGLITMLVFGPISQGVLRFYSIFNDQNKIGVYFYLFRHKSISSILILLLVALFLLIFTYQYMGLEWALIILASILFGVLSGVNGLLVSYLTALRKRKDVAILQAGDVWLRLFAAFVAIILINTKGYSALLGYCLGTVVITWSLWTVNCKQKVVNKHRIENNELLHSYEQDINKFIGPIRLFALFAIVSQYSDRWVIMLHNGEDLVGIYAVMYMIANAPIMLIANTTSQFIAPILFDKAGSLKVFKNIKSSSQSVQFTAFALTLIFIPIVIIAGFYGEEIIRLLSSEEFSVHGSILWVVVIGVGLANIAQILIVKGLVLNRTDIYIAPKIVQAVTFLLFAYLLIAKYGVLGVAISLCVSSSAYLLSVILVNRYVMD